MYSRLSLTIFLLFCLALFPSLAGAVPVEPSTGWVQRDRDTGRLEITHYTTAKYKTEFKGVATEIRTEVSRAGNRPDVRKLLAEARSHLGQPYVYGGAGPRSFDCSGFTLYVFKKVGINLPHLASSQAKYGTSVKKSELRPGDLVFFGYHGSSSIEHVGIYAGDGNFLHASSSKGVTSTPLDSGYYVRNYKGATRIIPS